MNFYKHYIGDFQRDTGHLSLTERGAYLTLIHHYYATEKPLPNDVNALCRIAGAVTKAERDSVKAVMAFFEVVESGLMHSRIEAELEKSGVTASKNREIALAREAKRRAIKSPPNEHEQSTKRAQSVQPSVSPHEHELSTNQNQTPDTISIANSLETHTQLYFDQGASACLSPGLVCKRIVELGIPPTTCNPGHPNLTALLEAGATMAEFEGAARTCVEKGKGFAYLLGIVKSQREQAANLVLHRGRMPNRQEAVERSNAAVTAGWLPPELREVVNAN